MILPEFDSTAVLAASAVASLILTILGSFWHFTNYLRDKFEEVKCEIHDLLDTHEEKDQGRHEDNLQRFAVLETQLETIINGHPVHH